MKIGVIGDLHLTNHSPERRQDDYFQTILGKLRQAMDIFKGQGVHWIVQVGDFFDTPTVANRVKSAAIKLLLEYNQRVLCIWGQHDITGHSAATLLNSPLAVLESAGAIQIVSGSECKGLGAINQTREQPSPIQSAPQAYLYGAPFGIDVPTPVPHENALNILVTHQMIGDRPLYPGQPLASPRVFLRGHPGYQLVLCGDYHYPFQDTYDGRVILNVGCLVRKNIKDVDMGLQPAVATVDLETLTVERHPLQVVDASEAFDLTREVKPEKDEAALQRLVEDLRNSRAVEAGWQSILLRVLEEQKVGEDVRDVLSEAMEEVNPHV